MIIDGQNSLRIIFYHCLIDESTNCCSSNVDLTCLFLSLFHAVIVDIWSPLTQDTHHHKETRNKQLFVWLFASMHLLIIMQRKLMLQSPSSSPAVYRYFSDRARAKAARNLSIATWTSGVKSLGNMMARTTRMLWDRICEQRTITQMLHNITHLSQCFGCNILMLNTILICLNSDRCIWMERHYLHNT